jgi:site-specific recombinase XerD
MDNKLDNIISLRNDIARENQDNIPSIGLHTYIQAATSQNTRRAYQQDIRHFLHSGGLLPATPDGVISYLQHFAPILNSRTLARRLTAIKHWHTCQGFTDPTAHPLVRKALAGIKNIHGRPKHKAQALQMEQLITMTAFLKNRGELIDLRNNAMLQVGFFGAFRRSELTAIHLEHVRYVPEGAEILIPRSKTDQGGEGFTCAIPYGDEILCPVTALKTWCEKACITKGPIFRRITKGGNISHVAIDAHHINIIIKNIAHSCNLPNPEKYSSHSLRRGFATTASQQGASLSSIMQQGRWQHTGTALGYMEEGNRFKGNAAGLILRKRNKTQDNSDEKEF